MRRALALGLAGGLLWGVAARVFMRLLATVPAFSWSGTLLILGLAAVAGGAVGVVHGARTTGRSAWWRVAGLPFVVIFGSLGALLAPSALGVAALLRGGRVLRVVGGLLVLGTPALLVLTNEDGAPTLTQWIGLAVLAGCVVVQGWALGELLRRWRPPTLVGTDRQPVVAAVPA